MQEPFKLGDICIVISASAHYAHLVGREVTIRSALTQHLTTNRMVKSGYSIDLDEPTKAPLGWFAPHHCLRKKEPPRDDFSVVRWSECVWQPAIGALS